MLVKQGEGCACRARKGVLVEYVVIERRSVCLQ